MKKLALALVCLVSVAFFASCTKPVDNPEPTIAVMTGDNFVYDGQTVDLGVTYSIGFRAVSNTQTKKELAKFNLHASLFEMDGTQIASNDSTITVTGNEFVFQNDHLVFEHTNRELVGKAIFTATITDVDGKTKSIIVNVNVNQPAQPLTSRAFDWYRLGNTQTGLEEFGLYWERNIKETHAQIKPLDGVTLYSFKSADWAATTTDIEKAALFSDGAFTIPVYNNVSTSAGNTYDDVIGTKMGDGTLHLIHITKCVIGDFQAQGYPITISGEVK